MFIEFIGGIVACWILVNDTTSGNTKNHAEIYLDLYAYHYDVVLAAPLNQNLSASLNADSAVADCVCVDEELGELLILLKIRTLICLLPRLHPLMLLNLLPRKSRLIYRIPASTWASLTFYQTMGWRTIKILLTTSRWLSNPSRVKNAGNRWIGKRTGLYISTKGQKIISSNNAHFETLRSLRNFRNF